jgi:Kef-type K+ transport system membrane component KefB
MFRGFPPYEAIRIPLAWAATLLLSGPSNPVDARDGPCVHLLGIRSAMRALLQRGEGHPRVRPASFDGWRLPLFLLVLCAIPATLLHADDGVVGHGVPLELLWIAVVLVAARASNLIERLGQPAVLGELLVGVLLGNLVLFGLPGLDQIRDASILQFLAELGVIVLLFQIGLESNIAELRRVGFRALTVAVVGLVAPFVLGAYLVGPVLMPGQSVHTYLFMGAALTATSVGITARVFRDLGKLHLPEAKIVLGAAVIDDVLGLALLAVISALVTAGSISSLAILWILAKSLLFLVGAVVVGQASAPILGLLFSRIQSGAGAKLTLALSLALVMSYVAGVVGLAPIVGAFAAGLVLDPVHFRTFEPPALTLAVAGTLDAADPETRSRVRRVLDHYAHRHVEDLIEPIGHFLVPIFFVLTGMAVSLETLLDLPVLLVALALTVVAFLGKLASGLAAGPGVRKGVVGLGMVPRGEVGLIFVAIGRGLGVVSDEVFSVIVLVVVFTTLLTPPLLSRLLREAPDRPLPPILPDGARTPAPGRPRAGGRPSRVSAGRP